MSSPSSDENILSLNLDENEEKYKNFIQGIIDTHLYEFQPDPKAAGKPVKKNDPKPYPKVVYSYLNDYLKKTPLRRTPIIQELIDGVETWYFMVKLKHQNVELYILIRKVDLYLVGYKDKDGKWILLRGKSAFKKNQVLQWFKDVRKEPVETRRANLGDSYNELFSTCIRGLADDINKDVETALKVVIRETIQQNKKENISGWKDVEKRLSLKDSAEALKELLSEIDKARIDKNAELCEGLTKQKNIVINAKRKLEQDISVKRMDTETAKLNLNRDNLIIAVNHLKKESSDEEDNAKHVIILITMICEAIRFRKISDHIKEYYCRSVTLSNEMIHLINKWTVGSKVITYLGKERPVVLGDKTYTLEEFLPYFSCIRGTPIVLHYKASDHAKIKARMAINEAGASTPAKEGMAINEADDTGSTTSDDSGYTYPEFIEIC